MADIQVIAQLKTEENREYLCISSEKRKLAHGGNQSWWEPEKPVAKRRDFTRFRKEKDFRMARLGCGVIAMCDLQNYLVQKMGSNEIEYREYVEKEAEERYRIGGDLLHYITGLTPFRMKRGLRSFAEKNGVSLERINWAPHWIGRKKAVKTLECICEMLRGNLPVICSYHTFKKRGKLALYSTPEEAAGLVSGSVRQYIDSHYMTIVGVYRVYDGIHTQYVLKVVSWGSIYYVSYEDYSRQLNFFSNILKIVL